MPSSMNWVDSPTGGTPISAANLNKLAVIADLGTPGTPTGDAARATFESAAQITAPTTPAVNQPWTSSALRHLRIAPGAALRTPVLTATQTWEQGVCQEPLVYSVAGQYRMIYGGGWTLPYLGYATCAGDPTKAENWTKPLTGPLFGRDSSTGFAGVLNHCGLFIENGTMYLYFNPDANTPGLSVATASVTANPPVFTVQGHVFDMPASSGQLIANTFVVRDDTQTHHYSLFYEVLSSGWQIGVATGDSPSGPFTNVRNLTTSLQPFPGSGASNPWVELENGEYVMYFHASVASDSFPSQIYRAHTPRASLTADAWVLDNQARPLIRRAHRYEVDQVADICLARASGTTPRVALWSAVDNAAGTSTIMASPMLPSKFMWDGLAWIDQTHAEDPTPAITDAQKPVMVELTADFSVSGAAATMMQVNFVPTGTRAMADFAGFATNDTQFSSDSFQFVIRSLGITKKVGKFTHIAGSNSSQNGIAGKALLSGLTPGQLVTVELQVGTDSGTFFCRPVSQPGGESCSMSVQDAALWPSRD